MGDMTLKDFGCRESTDEAFTKFHKLFGPYVKTEVMAIVWIIKTLERHNLIVDDIGTAKEPTISEGENI